ncbi:unnamed protein product [Ectocarpus sp. CCAP 1310/34]|nr:unnamed protein product [Ectocarpus sp. CCAP 1310/34]
MPKGIVDVAVDLGTSRTAIGISIPGRSENEVTVCTPNGSGHCRSAQLKTETAALLEAKHPHGLLAFGKTARERFIKDAQRDEDGGGCTGRRTTSGAPNMLFRFFKTELCKNSGYTSVDQPVATAEGGETLPLMTVMTAVLRHIKEDVLAHLSQRLEVDPTVADVNWVVTIPAIYDDFAKRFMRVSAHRAGIISAVDDASQLQLCLEPEAACLAVSIKEAPLLAKAGIKLMIVDCGGGTVDITTHSVESRRPLKLKELATPTGGEWGSVCVDSMFMVWLRKLFGATAFARVRTTWAFYSLMDYWEEAKTAFQGKEDEDVSLNMVDVVMELGFDKGKLAELVAAHNHDLEPTHHLTRMNHYIDLPSGLVRTFFAPTIDKIGNCLRSLRGKPLLRDLKYVFLVGGFSCCPLVQQAARAELDRGGCRVIDVDRRELAIVRGATIFASNQLAFSRIAKLTYGVKSTCIYDSSNAEHVKRRSSPPIWDSAGKEVIDAFSTHIKRGAYVPSDGTCTRRCYGPLRPNQTTVSFQILACHHTDIEFPDTDSTFPLGEVTVNLDMRASFEDRGIAAEFVFCESEFLLRCFRGTTGERVAEVEMSLVQEVQEM